MNSFLGRQSLRDYRGISLRYNALKINNAKIASRKNLIIEYKDLIDEDMVIASGIVEGAARYVVGERLDCSGMRWIPERAEVVLHLRCIELNGDWERFFAWSYQRWRDQMRTGQRVLIRTDQAEALPTAVSIKATDRQELEPSQHAIAA